MEYSYLELLVQSDSSMVRDNKMRGYVIDFTAFILQTLLEVISLFYIDKKFELFDPHVGDTACQIRACFMVIFANNSDEISIYLKRLKEIKKVHTTLTEFKEKSKRNLSPEKNNNYTIRELVDSIGIHFFITEEEKILFQSYFLTLYKKKVSEEAILIDFDKISHHLTLSRKLSKKLTRHYQLSLASYSCNKIAEWGSLVLNPMDLETLKLVRRLDDDEREVLPCYLFTKVIYNFALRQNISIFIMVTIECKVIPLYFKAKENEFIFSKILPDDLQKPCILISGHSQGSSGNYLQRFIATGLKDILLSAMAAHPQYTGQKLSPYNQNIFQGIGIDNSQSALEEERHYMQFLASILGCSYENQSLFVVNHIFCGTIQPQNVLFDSYIEPVIKEFAFELE
ncbi:MAG: hypothetical protein H0U70_10405 [Tatlockia sp.]|nr:hypothetical protein [Tatlockia sp.]